MLGSIYFSNVVMARWSLVTLVLSALLHSAACDNAALRAAQNGNYGCQEANRHFLTVLSHQSLNQSHSDMLGRPVSGDHLQICQKTTTTCCSREMESILLDRSAKDYQRAVQDKIVGLLHTFERRTTKFDRFFRDLLRKARAGLHDMFKSTYGFLYEQNADVFTSLFDSLTDFYVSGKVNLDAVMKTFYVTLYQRMFQLINRPHHFGSDYWDCVVKHMDTLKPFGDVPAKMSLQVRRSFVAARSFVQSLMAGQEVVNKIMMIPPNDQCGRGLMRMSYCAHCHNLPSVKPCENFCLNVVQGCLAYQTELDTEWNHYIDSLLRLLERLEGPFNIESVIDPIDVKISEAIMTFHDSGPEISQKVFAGCGQPPNVAESGDAGEISRLRRSATHHRSNSSAGRKSSQHKTTQQAIITTTSAKPPVTVGTNLESLTKDIREKIQWAKEFWSELPRNLCNDPKIAAPADQQTDCWNGLKKDKYLTPAVADGLASQAKNPEVPVDTSRPDSVVAEQSLRLKTVTNLLQKAYNGNDVSWNSEQQIPKDVGASPKRPKSRQFDVVEGSGSELGDVGSGDSPIDEDAEMSTKRPSGTRRPTTFESDDEDLPGETDKVDDSDEVESSGDSDGAELEIDKSAATKEFVESELEGTSMAPPIWGYPATQATLPTEKSTPRSTVMSTRRQYTTPRWTTQADRGRIAPDFAVDTATPGGSNERKKPTSGTASLRHGQLPVGRVLWLSMLVGLSVILRR